MIENLIVLQGDDPLARDIIDEIIDIYNTDKEGIAKASYMKIGMPESIVVIYHPLTGGIILDRIRSRESPEVRRWICQYIAVRKENRGMGFASGFVALAQAFAIMNNGEFVGAYVESSEQIELWEALGFKHQGNIGFSLAMFDRPNDDLFKDKENSV